jgi:hypothetical protein
VRRCHNTPAKAAGSASRAARKPCNTAADASSDDDVDARKKSTAAFARSANACSHVTVER